MKKLYILTLLFISSLSFGQGLETFTNSNATASYTNNNFVGDNGVTWTYVASRDENGDANASGINGKALMLRRSTEPSSVTSSSVAGGVGDFTVKLYKGFTGAGNRQVELFVNGVSRGTSTPFDDFSENIFTVTGINQPGNVTIELRNITTRQVIVDDISWTAYSGPASPSLSITSPSNATVFSPVTTNVNVALSIANFNVANGTGDGHIHYQVTKDAVPQGVVMKYDTTPIALTGLTPGSYSVYVELVDNSHNPIAPAVNATVTFVISSYTVVADLAALRADVTANGAGKYYQVSSNPVITYARSSTYRNQKYIQDASAGILIDDLPGTISTAMVIGDAISGLRGQSSLFNGVLQLLPTENATVASSGNTVTPQVVTIADITGNIETYESELVQINAVSFVEADGSTPFATSTNYTLDDTANTLAFRTSFAEANYIGSLIPSGTQNVVVLVAEFNGTAQVTARNVVDMPLETRAFNTIDGLTMYPNPSNGNTLYFTTSANAELDIQVYDVLGKQIINSKVLNNTLNISNLNQGIYIVKITEEGKTATRKLVVK